MRNHTEDFIKSLKPEDIERRMAFTVNGKRKRLPNKIGMSVLKEFEIYEAESISDLREGYDSLATESKVPKEYLKWVNDSLAEEISFNQIKESFRLAFKYRKIMNDYMRVTKSFLPSPSIKYSSKQVLLADVKLKNFAKVENPLFTLYTFDVIDRNNDSMAGNFLYDSKMLDMIMTDHYQAVRQRFDAARLAPPGNSYMIYANALGRNYKMSTTGKERGYMIKVLDIREPSGGRKIDPPLISV